MADSPHSEPASKSGDGVGDLVQLVKDYARQETLGPLKGWGRYVAFGVAGSFAFSVGVVFVVLGVLRLLQTETDAFDGPNTSILAYAIALGVCVLVIGLAAWQIARRTSLQRKEPS